MRQKPKYPVPEAFAKWLESERGRATALSKADPVLSQATLSRVRHGVVPISLELAIRLERSQPPSAAPLQAEMLATYVEDRELIAYMRAPRPSPAPSTGEGQ